jgi:hypothetical protein
MQYKNEDEKHLPNSSFKGKLKTRKVQEKLIFSA